MTVTDIESLLLKHAVVSHGATVDTPDACLCGAELMPDRRMVGEFPEEISISRRRAFAQHVAEQDAAASEGNRDLDRRRVLNAFNRLPYSGSVSSGWGTSAPEELTFAAVADRLDAFQAVLNAVAETNTENENALRALRDQRTAVRDFFGLAES